MKYPMVPEIVVGIICLSLTPSYADDEKSVSDSARVSGIWTVGSYEEAGVSLSKDITRNWEMRFDADSVSSTFSGKSISGTFHMDQFKSPKRIDLVWKGTPDGEKLVHAIYELKGDNLRICCGEPGSVRPSRFASDLASGTCVIVLARKIGGVNEEMSKGRGKRGRQRGEPRPNGDRNGDAARIDN